MKSQNKITWTRANINRRKRCQFNARIESKQVVESGIRVHSVQHILLLSILTGVFCLSNSNIGHVLFRWQFQNKLRNFYQMNVVWSKYVLTVCIVINCICRVFLRYFYRKNIVKYVYVKFKEVCVIIVYLKKLLFFYLSTKRIVINISIRH